MRKLQNVYYALFLVALSACGGSEKNANSETSPTETGDSKEVTLETLKLRDLEGNKVDLATLSGKRVFVNFWATWCKPCLAEMPSIDKAIDQVTSEEVVFIAASDEKLDRIKKFKEKTPYRFRILSTEADLSALEIFALPATLIFDKQGKLVYKETGAREWDSAQSIALIMENKQL